VNANQSSATEHVLDLAFWGLSVRLALPTAHDLRHFSFQFRNYLSRPGRPDLLLRFTNSGTEAWCRALLDPRARKTVEYQQAGCEPAVYETWYAASSKPSPLPPLQFLAAPAKPLAVHAACAVPSHVQDGAVVITGASGSGKSSLLLYLLEEGWSYVADDLLPYLDGRVWTYLRTMNVRAHTLATLPTAQQAAIRHCGLPIDTPSGTTVLVHPRDLGYRVCTEPTRSPAIRIRLEPGRHFKADTHPRPDGSLRIAWDVARHRGQALRAVERAVASRMDSEPTRTPAGQ
jgi:hypothetical protein